MHPLWVPGPGNSSNAHCLQSRVVRKVGCGGSLKKEHGRDPGKGQRFQDRTGAREIISIKGEKSLRQIWVLYPCAHRFIDTLGERAWDDWHLGRVLIGGSVGADKLVFA